MMLLNCRIMVYTEMYLLLFSAWISLCDGASDSLLQIDSCNLCSKDNSSCRIISGLFTRPQLPTGYNLITQLPRSACNLSISQLKRTNNFVALRRFNGSYILNGGFEISWSRDFESAGTNFTYTRSNEIAVETIYSAGPLHETIDLMLIYQEPNPGVKYQYQFPMLRPEALINTVTPLLDKHFAVSDEKPQNNEVEMQRSNDHFFPFGVRDKSSESSVYPEDMALRAKHKTRRRKAIWKVVGFTECSKVCGGGIKSPVVLCVREYNQMPVPERRCAVQQKPFVPNLQCNVKPCAAQWVAGEWNKCSVTCGEGFQTRDISCKQDISPVLSINVADDSCNTPAPELLLLVRNCHQPPCVEHIEHKPKQNDWQVGPWSMCSVTCGMGFMSRTAHCLVQNCNNEKPSTESVCDMGLCPSIYTHRISHVWLFTEWSQQCSESCGTGVQTRKVKCSSLEHQCNENSKPESARDCFSDKRCNGQWYSGPWGQCSVKCGWGKQQRSILCIRKQSGMFAITMENHCLSIEKPIFEQQCYIETCGSEWYTTEWSQCVGGCQSGVQMREVQCLDDNLIETNDCIEDRKPETQQSCSPAQCTQITLDNSIPGINFEHDQTFSSHSHVNDNVIIGSELLADNNQTTNRNTQSKSSTSVAEQHLSETEDCEDIFHNCNLVVQSRLCKYKYYHSSCCRSCRH